MAFAVYPTSPQPPLPVAHLSSSTAQPFTQLALRDPAWDPPYAKVMYLRVGMTGPLVAPRLWLRAGAGPEVEVAAATTPVYRDAAATDYVGDVTLSPDLPGVLQLQVGIDLDTTDPWSLRVENRDPAADGLFTWVVGDTLAGTAQPWLSVTPSAIDALVGATVQDSVTIANRGTTPVSVIALNPAPTGPLSLVTPLPLTIAPGANAALVVRFAAPAAPPPPDGHTRVTSTLTVVPDDTTAAAAPAHTKTVTVDAVTQRLEIALLVDDSGSMSWDPAGGVVANPAQSRWGQLLSAAADLLALLSHFGAGGGRIGIAAFPVGAPGEAPMHVATLDPIPPQGQLGAALAKLGSITPTNGTPMGDGLVHVTNPAGGYFSTDPVEQAANRRVLVLMTDGATNTGVPPDTLPPLANGRIALFAVGYGLRGASNVDLDQLARLASHSLAPGPVQAVNDASITAVQLRQAFASVVKQGLTGVASAADPVGVFRFGQADARHAVLLTEHDGKAAFTLSWNTPDAGRLRLELLTPNCEVITPEEAGQGRWSGVLFRGDERSNAYYLDASVPANADDPGSPRYGTWTLVVSGPHADEDGAGGGDDADEGGGVERYGYDVLTESTLTLRLDTDGARHYAGDPLQVTARLTADGLPVTGASVEVSVDEPTRSLANWIAGVVVPAGALARAAEQLGDRDSTPLLVKLLAARLAGFTFDDSRRRAAYVLTDRDGDGRYRATIPGYAVPEEHRLYVTATGRTAGGVAFHREAAAEVFVRVRPTAAATELSIQATELGAATVVVVPRDRFGNVVLVDPATAGHFGLRVRGGRATGPLISDLDGTYHQDIEFDPRRPATVTAEFEGRPVGRPRAVLPPEHLHYVDTVVDFTAGAIVAANRHADPEAALGSVLDKPDDAFVSLGGGGRLTLGLRDRVIRAGGGDDVCVFVHPEAERRSYRVEAQDMERQRWVNLGHSIGVTQGFSLRQARVVSARSLRIVDTSGRVRAADRTPLDSPGVGVRGVGVLRTHDA